MFTFFKPDLNWFHLISLFRTESDFSRFLLKLDSSIVNIESDSIKTNHNVRERIGQSSD